MEREIFKRELLFFCLTNLKAEANKMNKINNAAKEKKWINLETEDECNILRDWFIKGTVNAGADSVDKLMAVTYLSQFENLNGEFATNPVFPPDFRIGKVPYSSALLEMYNYMSDRGFFLNSHGTQIIPVITDEYQMKINLDDLVERGAQLSRLYQANKKNLEKFAMNNKESQDVKHFFSKVRACYQRDKKLIESLTYVTNPITSNTED